MANFIHVQPQPNAAYTWNSISFALVEEHMSDQISGFQIIRNSVCRTCQGTGCINNAPRYNGCQSCHRDGYITSFDFVIRDCFLCWGKGASLIPVDRCLTCHGRGAMQVRTIDSILKVYRDAGKNHGNKIIFKNTSADPENLLGSDVYNILQTVNSPVYTTNGNNLNMKVVLQLVEEHRGFDRLAEVLENRTITVPCPRGTRIENNELRFSDAGLNPINQINLIIQFCVETRDQTRARLESTPPLTNTENSVDKHDCYGPYCSNDDPYAYDVFDTFWSDVPQFGDNEHNQQAILLEEFY